VARACRPLEIFGGEDTEREIHALLTDAQVRERLRTAQTSYLRRVEKLPSPVEVLEEICPRS
jgi:hypothetical protein